MVALLDVIPMIGATLGAVIVTAIGFATDPKIGIACVIFYVIYQQVENYVIYPRVMSRSVDIPGAVTVIAALVGAAPARRRRRPARHPHRRRDPAARRARCSSASRTRAALSRAVPMKQSIIAPLPPVGP